MPSLTRSGRPSFELRLELAFRQDVDRVPREVGDGDGRSIVRAAQNGVGASPRAAVAYQMPKARPLKPSAGATRLNAVRMGRARERPAEARRERSPWRPP